MSEQKEVKSWWADLLTPEELEEFDCIVGTLLSEHPRQGPLDWQERLFQVVPKSDFDAQSKLLQEKDQELEFHKQNALAEIEDLQKQLHDEQKIKFEQNQRIADLESKLTAHFERGEEIKFEYNKSITEKDALIQKLMDAASENAQFYANECLKTEQQLAEAEKVIEFYANPESWNLTKTRNFDEPVHSMEIKNSDVSQAHREFRHPKDTYGGKIAREYFAKKGSNE